MNLKTNTNHKLFIALRPHMLESHPEEHCLFTELTNLTEFQANLSYKKEDRTYFHNEGDTTSITTGRTLSYTATFDFDIKNPVHKYLYDLILHPANKVNNQAVKVVIHQEDKKYLIALARCTFNFKNFLPSGSPTDLETLSFEIYPQGIRFLFEEREFNNQTPGEFFHNPGFNYPDPELIKREIDRLDRLEKRQEPQPTEQQPPSSSATNNSNNN